MSAETDSASTILGVELKSLRSMAEMAGAKGVLVGFIWERGDQFTVDFACHKIDTSAARMLAGQIIACLAVDERLSADGREVLLRAFDLLGLERPQGDNRSEDRDDLL